MTNCEFVYLIEITKIRLVSIFLLLFVGVLQVRVLKKNHSPPHPGYLMIGSLGAYQLMSYICFFLVKEKRCSGFLLKKQS